MIVSFKNSGYNFVRLSPSKQTCTGGEWVAYLKSVQNNHKNKLALQKAISFGPWESSWESYMHWTVIKSCSVILYLLLSCREREKFSVKMQLYLKPNIAIWHNGAEHEQILSPGLSFHLTGLAGSLNYSCLEISPVSFSRVHDRLKKHIPDWIS